MEELWARRIGRKIPFDERSRITKSFDTLDRQENTRFFIRHVGYNYDKGDALFDIYLTNAPPELEPVLNWDKFKHIEDEEG